MPMHETGLDHKHARSFLSSDAEYLRYFKRRTVTTPLGLVIGRGIARHVEPTEVFRRLFCYVREKVLKRSTLKYRRRSAYLTFEKEHRKDDELNSLVPLSFPAIPDSASPYPYEALESPQHIRCCDVLPGLWDAPVTVRLVCLALETNLEYECLSYCWGDPAPKTAVICQSGYIPATTKVAALLRRLRHPRNSRRIWLDSICINQGDEEEKASQVKLMGRIYSNASKTIVWLGEEQQSTKAACDLVHDLDHVITQALPGMKKSWPTFYDLRSHGLPGPDDVRWEDLTRLQCHPWFTRTWVLQEVSLSSNPWIQQGPHLFPWRELVNVTLSLCNAGVMDYYRVGSARAQAMSFLFYNYRLAHKSIPPNLLGLLSLTRDTTCSRRQDKVFALMGLAADGALMRNLIDYGKTVEQVYTETATHFLLQGDFAVLNLASDAGGRDLHSMPTWVPDWSSWPRAFPIIRLVQNSVINVSYFPCKQSNALPKVTGNNRVLILRGAIVDRVKATGKNLPQPHRRITDRTIFKVYISQWWHIVGTSTSYPTGDTMEEAFARTITLNWQFAGTADCNYAGLYLECQEQLQDKAWAIGVYVDSNRAGTHDFKEQVVYASRMRTFFVTSKGYMGLGPFFLRPGDLIVRFDSVATPFAVRKAKNGCFELVGDTYIHGMMDGKLVGANIEEIRLV